MILFGLQGSGKTFFGTKLARNLSLPFIDTDQLIQIRHPQKLSCREICQQEGELSFRKLETEIICSLVLDRLSVIAVGGGSLLCEENRKALQVVTPWVHLVVDKEVRRARMKGVPAYLSMEEERLKLYRQLATVEVVIGNQSEEEVLALLRDVYGQ